MASRVSVVTQAFSAPTVMDTVTNAMTQHATTNITVSTSNLYTVAFTAANVGDEITGVAVYVTAKGSGGTITAYLQEFDGVATWADVGGGEGTTTIAVTDLQLGGWVYLRASASYTATTAAAGRYRWRFVNAGAAGTTTFAADTAGTAISYLSTDNRNTTTKPGTSDDILVAGNKYAAVTLTLDGTQTIGSFAFTGGTSTEAAGIRCNTGLPTLDVAYGGTVADDTAANVDFTLKGSLVVRKGGKSYRNNGLDTAYPSARTSIYRFNQNSVSGNHGIIHADGGVSNWIGMVKTGTSVTPRTYVSGAGTAADPMITSGDIGEVGDEVIIFATSDTATNYNECEHRFIKTKNSSTSYVLSTTAGGAEAALTYVHTAAAKIINVERNVKCTSTTTTHGYFMQGWELTAAANLKYNNVSFEYCGSTAAYKFGIYLSQGTTGLASGDYCVFIRRIGVGIGWRSRAAETYTGHVITGQVSTNAYPGVSLDAAFNKTLNDFVVADDKRMAIGANGNLSGNVVFNRLEMNAAGKDGGINTFYTGFMSSYTINNSNFNACRVQAAYLAAAEINFYNCNFGVNGKNQTTDIIAAAGFCTSLFHGCKFASTTMISGYTSMVAGSLLRFHNADDDASGMNHEWYTPYGSARACMAGLVDTTVTPAGHPTVRIAPEDSTTGFTWEFQVPVFEGYSASILCLLRRNATFTGAAGSVVVEVWLPGSTVADATYTMSTVTEAWETAVAGITYGGSIDAMATIKIIAKTTTAGAHLYVGDLYGGTNPVTALDVWSDGMPSNVMFDQIGNAAAVWAALTSTFTIAGTAGKALLDAEVEIKNLPALIN